MSLMNNPNIKIIDYGDAHTIIFKIMIIYLYLDLIFTVSVTTLLIDKSKVN